MLAHESRQAQPWLIFDVRQKMTAGEVMTVFELGGRQENQFFGRFRSGSFEVGQVVAAIIDGTKQGEYRVTGIRELVPGNPAKMLVVELAFDVSEMKRLWKLMRSDGQLVSLS